MLKQIKPTTPSLRHKIKITTDLINIQNKNLSIVKKKTGGRNFLGKITVRHIGGGHKQRIKLIDNYGLKGSYTISKITNFVYDPNRSNYLALCKTPNNKEFLRLSAEGQKIGDIIYGKYCPLKKELNNSDIMPLKNIPVGTKIFNIELNPGKGMRLARAAGVYATIIKHVPIYEGKADPLFPSKMGIVILSLIENKLTTIKLASKKIIILSSDCLCNIGINNNIDHHNKILGKAGANRWRGIRPTVRGEAMNPIDHPHGGETSGGVRLKTVYGKLAKFVKTR